MQIYKYHCGLGKFQIEMPKWAKILSFQCQHNDPMIWALINPEAETEIREFIIVGTGHGIPPEIFPNLNFIDTVQVDKGQLVWHLFEIRKP